MPLYLKGAAPGLGVPDRRYYMLDVQVGKRRLRLSTGTRDKAKALDLEQRVLDALRADPTVTQDEIKRILAGTTLATVQNDRIVLRTWTLKDTCEAILKDRKEGGWGRARSNDTYRVNCRLAQSYFGADTPVATITLAHLEAYAAHLQHSEGNADGTVNRKLFALSRVLGYAKRHGQYPQELPRWKPFSEKYSARQFVLTPEDERELFAAIRALDSRQDGPEGGNPVQRDAHHYVDYFTFLADVGCRSSQALKVRWRDLDYTTVPGEILVRFWRAAEQKGGVSRCVPCTARVKELLERRRPLGGEGPFMMLRRMRGNALWNLAKAETSLKDEKECVPHCLRHTCATRLLSQTNNLKLVQDWLGHSKIDTTAGIYAKSMVGPKVAALEALQRNWQ